MKGIWLKVYRADVADLQRSLEIQVKYPPSKDKPIEVRVIKSYLKELRRTIKAYEEHGKELMREYRDHVEDENRLDTVIPLDVFRRIPLEQRFNIVSQVRADRSWRHRKALSFMSKSKKRPPVRRNQAA